MIRIDLGKDELKKNAGSGAGKRLLKKLREARLSRFIPSRPKKSRVGSRLGNLGGTAILLIAACASVLPHLFFLQYKEFVENDHAAKMQELQEKTNLMNQEIAKLQPFQRELESYEAQKRLVKERLDIIRGLLAQRGTPVSVLDALGQSLPQRVWINNLDFDMKAASPVINVSGQSFSNEEISDYVDKLAESVHLQEINLESVTPNKIAGNVDVKSFQLVAVPKISRVPLSAKPSDAAKQPGEGAQQGQPAGEPAAVGFGERVKSRGAGIE